MPMPSAYETRSEAFFRLYEGETPQEIQTLLTRWIPKGSRVLELACGSSRDARFMSGLGAIVEELHRLLDARLFKERPDGLEVLGKKRRQFGHDVHPHV